MCDLQFYPVIEIREQDLYLQELSHNLSNSKPLTAIKVSLIVEGVDDKKVNIWEAKVPKNNHQYFFLAFWAEFTIVC
jgi:hypothetical protein